MDQISMNEMKRLLDKYLSNRFSESLAILDVGSQIVEKGQTSYKELLPKAWKYAGSDIKKGKNVDFVQLTPYIIQTESGQYDVVISGQVLEHVEEPWMLVTEMGRMLKPDGWMIITAPWRFKVHRYPIDCWRILPDGMSHLIKLAGLSVLETFIERDYCWGVGQKA